jgi:hypothetical protein
VQIYKIFVRTKIEASKNCNKMSQLNTEYLTLAAGKNGLPEKKARTTQ